MVSQICARWAEEDKGSERQKKERRRVKVKRVKRGPQTSKSARTCQETIQDPEGLQQLQGDWARDVGSKGL